ncbi:anti-sigma factor [Pseudonocardia acaciae]|uniref:anti-sigma factor n=1 Tax=Pseudonocardia acaciae TaxID=551276 RepID=UPI00048E5C17|nr:anti-sigma factor [Pseudonocardia acaciae]
MTNPDVHTLTGAYAVHALDELERRAFEAHLAECPDCAREVDELRAAAARLAGAVSEPPPERVRRRVMAQVAATRQDPPAASGAPAPPGDGHPRRWASWASRLTAAAAIVAVAAASALGVAAARAERERAAAQAEVSRLQSQYQQVAQLATAPDARAGTGTGVNGGTAFVLASHSLDQAVLLTSLLPTPPEGRTYQAWLIGGGQPRPVGLVPSNTSEATAPLVFNGLAGAAKVGLTIEPAGGSPQPTTTPVVLFDLPS